MRRKFLQLLLDLMIISAGIVVCFDNQLTWVENIYISDILSFGAILLTTLISLLTSQLNIGKEFNDLDSKILLDFALDPIISPPGLAYLILTGILFTISPQKITKLFYTLFLFYILICLIVAIVNLIRWIKNNPAKDGEQFRDKARFEYLKNLIVNMS